MRLCINSREIFRISHQSCIYSTARPWYWRCCTCTHPLYPSTSIPHIARWSSPYPLGYAPSLTASSCFMAGFEQFFDSLDCKSADELRFDWAGRKVEKEAYSWWVGKHYWLATIRSFPTVLGYFGRTVPLHYWVTLAPAPWIPDWEWKKYRAVRNSEKLQERCSSSYFEWYL